MTTETHFRSPAFAPSTFTLLQGWDATDRLRDQLGPCARLARWPHHTSSAGAILGGFAAPVDENGEPLPCKLLPGEMLMAGAGFLVLQDLPEFKRETVSAIARAWTTGIIALQAPRPSLASIRIPVRCSILATAHACPCGMLDRERLCTCSTRAREIWDRRVADAVAAFRGEGVRA